MVAPIFLAVRPVSAQTPASKKPASVVKSTAVTTPHTVRFQQDIRPVLSNICAACHGPDEKARKANLRLDTQEGVARTVVAHKPDASALYLRMKQTGPGQMPPPGFLRRPTPQQIELIGQWIKQGGKWEAHWAYGTLSKPAVPKVAVSTLPLTKPVAKVDPKTWPKNEIDRFILARLASEGISPSQMADRRTLLRRLSFDLTGLPPTYEEVQEFVNDRSSDSLANEKAYEKVVDRLLASPHFGERMAVYWLDLVRYADTRGYHGDQHQDISPYRDYVIEAFNKNKPFDQFTREQLAGDLLPTPNEEQRIASGYNKLLMTTEEGGSQAKEYLAKYAADRVRNLSAVWMGSTMGCCQCHDHKYDPFTTKDFYSMAAFFADIRQTAVGGLDITPLPTAEQSAQIATLSGKIATVSKKLDTQTPELDAAQAEWEKTAVTTLKKPDNIAAILAIDPAKRTDQQKQTLSTHYRTLAPLLAEARTEKARLQAELDGVNARVRKTMITTTTQPAEVRVLPRGNWLDDSGPVVQPAIPAFLGRCDTGERRANRLDLANWLTSNQNPLTARVMVNRLWALLFGHGLSRSVEDFGGQGVPPSHPELLDWLAADYSEHGWDTKRILKEMVLSAAYRQSSVPSTEMLKRDPGNDLFARQGRQRLPAEFVRDNALAVSGILVDRLGGPSVKPYQPAHYWDYLNFPMRTWVADRGDDEYRRGVYTYWCRTYLQPSLLAFDASTREECSSARVVSNTPQQALVLLNDPTYVEAARALAERVAHQVPQGTSATARIQVAYRLALQRDPTPKETETLLRLYERHRADYETEKTAADELGHVGDRPWGTEFPAQDLGALTSVTRVILNLHEVITRN